MTRVTAYAGTGKTTSLIGWAAAHPRWRILYLAFNRSVRAAAAARFPAHVTVRTSHALAFAATGRPYQAKLGPVRPWTLVQAFGATWRIPRADHALYARWLLDSLRRWWASADPEPTAAHLPPDAAWVAPGWWDPAQALRDLQRVWAAMADPHDPRVPMEHDGYLKRFALQAPRLPWDAIAFDEAQDANPVTVQIVRAQPVAQVWVGDPWQALYAFRGAIDAMATLAPDTDLRLTGSFRFGPAIAAAATRLLRWTDPTPPPVRGLGPATDTVRLAHSAEWAHAWLGRTNAGVLEAALDRLDAAPATRLGWVGGVDSYRFGWFEALWQLWQGGRPADPFLRAFPDWDALRRYADAAEDGELRMGMRLVERRGTRLPGDLARLRAATAPAGAAPDLWLSTVHKAKGLEWPTVRLLGDLPDLAADARARARLRALATQRTPDARAEQARLQDALLPDAELHVWYVAVTRAQQTVLLPPAGGPLLDAAAGGPA